MLRRISKAQQQALARIAARSENASYRQLRRAAVETYGCDEAIAVPWAGMWLCIELDGYTHS